MLNMPIPEEETGNKLGDWEFCDKIKQAEFVLPKVYRLVSATTDKVTYKCKGCPIVRKWEDPDMPEKRWNAFKNFAKHGIEDSEDARILGKDGITGLATDVKDGSLMPRRLEASCKTCRRTGVFRGVECPTCGGKGKVHKPLVRSLKSSDQKREWAGQTSKPLSQPLTKKTKKKAS